MSGLPDELRAEARRTLADLRSVQLAATAWPAVAGDLGQLASAIDHDDPDAVRGALVPVAQAAFEGKVRGRLAGADRRAALVVATKQTSALPAVGALCGAVVVTLGYLLGGWLVAAGTAVFGLFIFGVAIAGTRTTRSRVDARRAGLAPTGERTEPAPRMVAAAIREIESAL